MPCDYAILTCPPLVHSSSTQEQSSAVEQTVGFAQLASRPSLTVTVEHHE